MYAARSLTISLLSHRDDTDKTPSKHSVGRGFCKHRLHSATISSMWIYRKSSSGYLWLQHKGWNVPFCSMEHAGEVPFHLRCLGRVPHFEGSWLLVMILENWKKTKQFETNKQQKNIQTYTASRIFQIYVACGDILRQRVFVVGHFIVIGWDGTRLSRPGWRPLKQLVPNFFPCIKSQCFFHMFHVCLKIFPLISIFHMCI